MEDRFIKDDKQKANLAILFDTPAALEEIARVLSYGAVKYDRKNWALVDDLERYESASLRHLLSHHNGELIDPESNLSHLAHSIASQLFLLEILLNKK